MVNGNIIHERVHSGEHSFSSNLVRAESAVQLYHDELDIFGVADCIEFRPNSHAEFSEKAGGRYDVTIVEYKPTRPKSDEFSETDAIQVFAQKLCADHIYGASCGGVLYYSDVRRRVKLPFDENYETYYALLKKLLAEMRAVLDSGVIPDRTPNQICNGCSLESVCMPKCKQYSVRKEIKKQIRGNGN